MPWLKPLSEGSHRVDRRHSPRSPRTTPHHAHFMSSSFLSVDAAGRDVMSFFLLTISWGSG